MKNNFFYLIYLSALVAFSFSALAAQALPSPKAPKMESCLPHVHFSQQMVEDLAWHFNMDSVDTVFRMVFTQLPDSVFVWPTENYYYFRLFADEQWWWGNLRCCVLDRDKGRLNFAYYTYIDNPKSPNEGRFFSKSFSIADGVVMTKVRSLAYQVQYAGKSVLFQLNDLPQTPPTAFTMPTGELFVNRTFDESGLSFFLQYHTLEKRFFYILDEGLRPMEGFLPLNDELLLDPLRGFVFYVDKACANRKILVGVWAQNVRRNNYWDGPFDQLADNAPNPRLKEFLEAAYPYAKGGMDEFGFFKLVEGSRMAITPTLNTKTQRKCWKILTLAATK